jgi:ferritin-like metal-binding protein YciE
VYYFRQHLENLEGKIENVNKVIEMLIQSFTTRLIKRTMKKHKEENIKVRNVVSLVMK